MLQSGGYVTRLHTRLNTSQSKDVIILCRSSILLSEISRLTLESQKPPETWYVKYDTCCGLGKCLFVFPSKNDVMIKVVMLD